MSAAALLRIQIERTLAHRIPAALTPAARQQLATLPLGVPVVDALAGGLPLGAITELTGTPGSGRTALSLAAVAQATRSGHVAAWVDPANALDPHSAAASGVLLDRLLWVRCAARRAGPESPLRTAGNALSDRGVRAPHTERVQHGGGSPHPRAEERGLPEAVNALLATPAAQRGDRSRFSGKPGTPSAPNRLLARSDAAGGAPRHRLSLRIEQAGTDRQPSRRGSYVLEQRDGLCTSPAQTTLPLTAAPTLRLGMQTARPWQRIDQALRITDLLLQAGGFQLIVLDLADIAAAHVSRIPLATWFRFRAAAEHAQSTLLVLTQHPCTGSSSAMLLSTEVVEEAEPIPYFPGLQLSAAIMRQRFEPAEHGSIVPLRKPPRSAPAAHWNAVARYTTRHETGCP